MKACCRKGRGSDGVQSPADVLPTGPFNPALASTARPGVAGRWHILAGDLRTPAGKELSVLLRGQGLCIPLFTPSPPQLPVGHYFSPGCFSLCRGDSSLFSVSLLIKYPRMLWVHHPCMCCPALHSSLQQFGGLQAVTNPLDLQGAARLNRQGLFP